MNSHGTRKLSSILFNFADMDCEYLFRIDCNQLFFTGNQKIEVEYGLRIRPGLSVLVGRNGSGKSMFARILERGRNFRTNRIISQNKKKLNVICLEFNDIHNFSGLSINYYQQRYESSMNDGVPWIRDILGDKFLTSQFQDLCSLFNLKDLDKKRINYLSSGELRKLLIINSLLEKPDLLILDNPYIGLDSQSKEIVEQALLSLKNNGQSIMLLISDITDSPSFADNYLYADSLYISSLNNKENSGNPLFIPFSFVSSNKTKSSDPIVEMLSCEVKYGSATILHKFDWTVKEGERWSLTGPNGSGKSTLLSLINADNPKGYCNNIRLFGKERGSGESIWDIKRKIGYVSPEMQLHFHGTGSVLQIVANGLNDTVGLYIKPTSSQEKEAIKWLKHFKINHLSDRIFASLSSGEKQLVLIARSFIKQPLLLILDEPMHALDPENKKMVRQTIDDFLNSHPSSAFIMVTHQPEELPSSITCHKTLSKYGE